MKSLFEIQTLAKKNKRESEKEILKFLNKQFPNLKIQEVNINQSAVSLNSVNGFLKSASQEYFFKFHAEENEEQSLDEYYNSKIIHQAGLPVILPIHQSQKPGEQFLIYEKITAKTMFDILLELDCEYLETGKYNPETYQKVLEAEKNLCQQIFKTYQKTLRIENAEKIEKESINQLFFRRLKDKNAKARVELFYSNKTLKLPQGEEIDIEDFKKLKWVINNTEYPENLQQLIDAASQLLDPNKKPQVPVVTGHGDDHNGNKFVFKKNNKFEIKFFDPAFAGKNQPALLSFIKSTFHDTFAHPFWLYHSEKINTEIKYKIENNKIYINFDWGIHKSPIREELLKIKIAEIWEPLIKLLKEKKLLIDYYDQFIKKALFCCPFLVYNLTDSEKFPEEKSLLALAHAVKIGNKGCCI